MMAKYDVENVISTGLISSETEIMKENLIINSHLCEKRQHLNLGKWQLVLGFHQPFWQSLESSP